MEEQPTQQPETTTPPEEKKPSNLLIIILLILLIISLGISGFLTYQNYKLKQQITQLPTTPSPTTTATTNFTTNWKAYTNPEYNYTIKYPSNYILDELYPKYVSIKIPKNPEEPDGEVISLITASIEEDGKSETDEPPQSFENFIIEELKLSCLADGHNSQQFCDEVVKKISVSNPNGIKGLELYLRLVLERGGATSYQIKGPIFVFNITPDDSPRIIALVLEADYGFPDETSKEVLRKMVDTLKI